MPYVVTGKCVNCRYTDCVEVCPVSCFYLGENSVVINPDECIDCGVCEPECPIEAIKADIDLTPEEEQWADINKKFSALWPNVTESQGALPCADENQDKTSGEKAAAFSEKAGEV